jgi:hypothetical protein
MRLLLLRLLLLAQRPAGAVDRLLRCAEELKLRRSSWSDAQLPHHLPRRLVQMAALDT